MSNAAVKRTIVTVAGALTLAVVMQSVSAYADCAAGMAACPSDLGGGCVPMGSVCCPGNGYVPIGAVCDKDPTGNWGAIAVATWNDSQGDAHASATVKENAPSLSQASTAALLDCQKASVHVCHIVGTFANGRCGYVATGHNAKEVRWAVSSAPQDALNSCSTGGVTCQQPVGGCNNK
jgi:Domain of unknown function (DUF4189)